VGIAPGAADGAVRGVLAGVALHAGVVVLIALLLYELAVSDGRCREVASCRVVLLRGRLHGLL